MKGGRCAGHRRLQNRIDVYQWVRGDSAVGWHLPAASGRAMERHMRQPTEMSGGREGNRRGCCATGSRAIGKEREYGMAWHGMAWHGRHGAWMKQRQCGLRPQ